MDQEFFRDRLLIEIMLFLYNNHFCLLWKPEKVMFNQAFKEMNDDFEIVDN